MFVLICVSVFVACCPRVGVVGVGVAEPANWTLIKLFNMPCMQRAATFVLTHRRKVGGSGHRARGGGVASRCGIMRYISYVHNGQVIR